MANADAERVGVMSEAYSKNLQGAMAAATGEAMLNASQNDGNAMAGFVGMGMAQNAGANFVGAINNLPGQAPAQGTQAARFCPNCGASASDSAKFCTQCGTALN